MAPAIILVAPSPAEPDGDTTHDLGVTPTPTTPEAIAAPADEPLELEGEVVTHDLAAPERKPAHHHSSRHHAQFSAAGIVDPFVPGR